MSMHTPRDEAELIAAGVDPDTTQHRERGVKCRCCKDITWHLGGCCTHHYRAPAAVRRLAAA